MTASYFVLSDGYVSPGVASTVSLVVDGDRKIIVDPGMVASRDNILAPLGKLGVSPADITDVVVSHLHIDHTINIAIFPNATVHDFMASYRNDSWVDHDESPFRLSANVTLYATPGHTREDITTVVKTGDGLVAFTHLWWTIKGPIEDPYSYDLAELRASRELILGMNPHVIVPGHGSPFAFDGDATKLL
ncbi:MAG: MBL fold metallo-hydrolase [Actinomycetota bacterium]|nr:MBL fold metallo-hydrolase [Actinomycetota bacterium]